MSENEKRPEGEERRDVLQEPKARAEEEAKEQQGEFYQRFLADSEDLRAEKPIRQVNKNLLVIIVVVICAVAVGVSIIARSIEPAIPEYMESDKRPVVIAERLRQDVKSVELTQSDGTVLTFVADADFNITCNEYPEYPLKQTSLSSLFYAMGAITTEDTVADDSSQKAEFGFAPPTATANVTFTDGTGMTYYLGSKTPKGNTWYFMVEGRDEIFEVWSNVGNNMLGDLQSMRELETLPEFNYEMLEYLLIERPADAIEVVPVSDDEGAVGLASFRLTRPYAVPVDGKTETISALVETLTTLAIKGYVATTDDLSQYGLDVPRASLTIRDSDGAQIVVHIGDKNTSSDYFMRVGDDMDNVFTVNYTVAEAIIGQKAFALVDSFVALVSIGNIDSVTIETPGRTDRVDIARQEQFDENGELMVTSTGEPDYLETYTFNGQEVDGKTFRSTLYTAIIGITIDGEVPANADGLSQSLSLRVTYTLNTRPERFVVEYFPYKSLYCAASAGFEGEDNPILFYVQKTKVDAVISALTDMLQPGE